MQDLEVKIAEGTNAGDLLDRVKNKVTGQVSLQTKVDVEGMQLNLNFDELLVETGGGKGKKGKKAKEPSGGSTQGDGPAAGIGPCLLFVAKSGARTRSLPFCYSCRGAWSGQV